MINKQNLWFGTLFSLILVLGIYYVTIKDEELLLDNITSDSQTVIEINESNSLIALRVAEDERVLKEIEILEQILLDTGATLEEKNDAYDNLQLLNNQKSKAEEIETLIKEKFSYDAFIKIQNDNINITISGSEHNSEIANSIIRAVQEKYNTQMYITVKFEG